MFERSKAFMKRAEQSWAIAIERANKNDWEGAKDYSSIAAKEMQEAYDCVLCNTNEGFVQDKE